MEEADVIIMRMRQNEQRGGGRNDLRFLRDQEASCGGKERRKETR